MYLLAQAVHLFAKMPFPIWPAVCLYFLKTFFFQVMKNLRREILTLNLTSISIPQICLVFIDMSRPKFIGIPLQVAGRI